MSKMRLVKKVVLNPKLPDYENQLESLIEDAQGDLLIIEVQPSLFGHATEVSIYERVNCAA